MRILISNPDNIGDVILRQPMYAAVTAAGHELLLAVRSFVAPIAGLVAPEARVVSFESNPYSPDFDPNSDDIRGVLCAAREFAPDIFCIAPYQRTVFDEFLARSLEPCHTVGMSGVLYAGDINAGLAEESKICLDREVAVSVEQHETEKNERLCGELLGSPVRLPDPSIRAGAQHQEEARAIIARLGLIPGKYWIVCAGQNPYTAVRNWTLENWAKVLAHVVQHHRLQILLIGTPDEYEASEEIRRRMGSGADGALNLCQSPLSLPVTTALTQLSAGYIGRDTGIMHLAAAVGKPVVAVFGGGTWPRFTPRCQTGFVATLSMPCAGCDWICHLAESYCVKRVPAESIIQALDAIVAGDMRQLEVKYFQMDSMLSACTIRQSAEVTRSLIRRSARHADLAGKLSAAQADLQRSWEECASARTDRDGVEAQLHVERVKRDLLTRDFAQVQTQAETEKQNLMDILNDLLVQQSELSQQVADYQGRLQQSEQSLHDCRESLREHRRSLSFRLVVLAGRPVAILQRLLSRLLGRG